MKKYKVLGCLGSEQKIESVIVKADTKKKATKIAMEKFGRQSSKVKIVYAEELREEL